MSREQVGLLIRTLGNYVLPSVATGLVAYICQPLGPSQRGLISAGIFLGTGMIVFGVAALGDRIANGGILDSALKQAVRALVARLVVPEDREGDPSLPVLRITVFVPEKRRGVAKEQLYPKYRYSSAVDEVLSYGEKDFRDTAPLDKGDVLAGVSWQTRCSCYHPFRPYEDFPEHRRLQQWAKQWQDIGNGDPKKWSHYPRSVRSAWTFPLFDPHDPSRFLAVFEVYSTREHAFRTLEEFDSTLVAQKAPFFADVHLREVIESYVQSVVLVMLKRRRLDILKSQFCAKPKRQSMTFTIESVERTVAGNTERRDSLPRAPSRTPSSGERVFIASPEEEKPTPPPEVG